ncbi:DUF4147 domain-containing protein [Candidatus Uhrbacteria bacterium]|nr:DUF4147 domain-containing protein [Candidatus Uhrbacteria bacterium]
MAAEKHIIKNFKSLAKSALRRDALSILEAGIRAANPRNGIARLVKKRGDFIFFGNKKINRKNYDHIYVIGIGKASAAAASELERLLGEDIAGGVVLDVKKVKLRRVKSIAGTHPLPSLVNMRATGEIMALLKNIDSRDLVIAIISGGGSALLCWPYDIKCNELSAISKVLMKKGATIREINTVRKHLSEIQGGQFARLAYPATVVGLIFSDIPGNDLGLVASGPTVRDATTVTDAAHVLAKYNVLKSCSIKGCDLKETPKDPLYFKKVTNMLAGSNLDSVKAMAEEAKKRGWRVRVLSVKMFGEAAKAGKMLADAPKEGEAVIAAGETTVTVKGKGKGGRNQELALSSLLHLRKGGLVISLASDGIDNSEAAGGIADELTLKSAAKAGINPKRYLTDNDSNSFFKKLRQAIITGPTGANVSDIIVSLRR